jgi:hypothetical protein
VKEVGCFGVNEARHSVKRQVLLQLGMAKQVTQMLILVVKELPKIQMLENKEVGGEFTLSSVESCAK